MNILLVMLQSPQGAPQGGGSGLLMIRPQRKKAKEEQQMREQLKKGDRVLFSGGIYGKIHSVDATTVEVEVANGVIMTVEKSFIQSVANNNTPEEKK